MTLKRNTVRQLSLYLAIAMALGVSGCATYVMVPPRMDLGAAGTLGLVSFSTPGPVDPRDQASADFMQAMQSAQPGTPVIELGDRVRSLKDQKQGPLNRRTLRMLHDEYGVDSIVVGDLRISEPKPSLKIGASLKSVSVKTALQGTLNVRIVQTKSGATIWSHSARAEQPVARAAVTPAGIYSGGAQDRGIAEARLVQTLVHHATSDFRPRRIKQ
jgi:hypothetical protein